MIPIPVKIAAIVILAVGIAITLYILKKNNRKCDRCGKRMWFWEYVIMRPEKIHKNYDFETYVPIRHVKCENGK
jgi:hypothetical protein